MGGHSGFDKIQAAHPVCHGREFPVVVGFTTDSPGDAPVDIPHGVKNTFGMAGGKLRAVQAQPGIIGMARFKHLKGFRVT